MNSFAYSHSKFESIICSSIFHYNFVSCFTRLGCGELIFVLEYIHVLLEEPIHDKSDV